MKIKEIRNYPGYRITDDGHVYSPYGEIGWLSKSGYMLVALKKGDGSSKDYRIHRLVAEYFVPGHDKEHDIVDHINGDKLDNRAENLRWTDSRGNALYAHYEQGLMPDEIKAIPIKTYNIETGETQLFRSINEAAVTLGIPYWRIHDVVSGKRKTTAGYMAWKVK